MNLLRLRDRGKIERQEILVDYDDLYRRLPPDTRNYLEMARKLGTRGPKMGFGPFRQMNDGSICLINQTQITGTAETALFPVAQFSAFNQNTARAGQEWELTVMGIMTTASSSQGNITITPRWGTTTGGVSLGASAATALAASASNVPFRLVYDFDFRSVGQAGANSKMYGNGMFGTTVAAITAATGNTIYYGTTTDGVSVDFSIASGMFIGITLGSASDTMTVSSVRLESLN